MALLPQCPDTPPPDLSGLPRTLSGLPRLTPSLVHIPNQTQLPSVDSVNEKMLRKGDKEEILEY